MEFVPIGLGLAAFIAARIWLRRWVTSRWLDDRISDRQAGLLFALISLGPLIAIGLIAASVGGSPIVLAAVALVAAVVIGSALTMTDYMAAHGAKDALRASRTRK